MDKLSYAWGLAMGQQLLGMGVKNLNVDDYMAAVKAVLEGAEPALPLEEAQTLINEYLQNLEAEATKAAKEAGEKFMADNKTREGVKVTASGLQYVVEKEGEGAQPTAEDEVTVHYTGRLLNGQVFDSSVQRGEPATFPLNRVIPGWTEGLQLMKEGAKYEFIIPSYLAYGERGTPGGPIGPNATLYFEVELFKVNP